MHARTPQCHWYLHCLQLTRRPRHPFFFIIVQGLMPWVEEEGEMVPFLDFRVFLELFWGNRSATVRVLYNRFLVVWGRPLFKKKIFLTQPLVLFLAVLVGGNSNPPPPKIFLFSLFLEFCSFTLCLAPSPDNRGPRRRPQMATAAAASSRSAHPSLVATDRRLGPGPPRWAPAAAAAAAAGAASARPAKTRRAPADQAGARRQRAPS